MKAAVDNVLPSGGPLPSTEWRPKNLQLAFNWFGTSSSKYPEHGSKVTLWVRACFDESQHDQVLASWQQCQAILDGVNRIDVFGPARISSPLS